MPDKAVFDVAVDQIEFRTKTNGDCIKIVGVHLGTGAAANLATLINSGETLLVTVGKKEQ